jgi:hypothetical protein
MDRCCYITVDSAMAASQNRFCSYKLSFRKKTNIMQIIDKNIKIFIYLFFYHREIVRLDHFMTLSLRYANTVLLRSCCKIHRFVAAPMDSWGKCACKCELCFQNFIIVGQTHFFIMNKQQIS